MAYEDRSRPEKPESPPPQPGGPISPLLAVGAPGDGVCVTADEEEDRDHLEEPGDPMGPAHLEGAPTHRHAILDPDIDHHPVTYDDGDYGQDPEEVHIPVPVFSDPFGQFRYLLDETHYPADFPAEPRAKTGKPGGQAVGRLSAVSRLCRAWC